MTNKAIAKAEAFLATHDNPFHVRTAFFDSKIKTLFTRFDMDNNGKIEKEDFESWSNRLAATGYYLFYFKIKTINRKIVQFPFLNILMQKNAARNSIIYMFA